MWYIPQQLNYECIGTELVLSSIDNRPWDVTFKVINAIQIVCAGRSIRAYCAHVICFQSCPMVYYLLITLLYMVL